MDDPLGVHVNAGGEGEPPQPLPPDPGARVGARRPQHPSRLHEEVDIVFVGGQCSFGQNASCPLLSDSTRATTCPYASASSGGLLQSDAIMVPVPDEM